MDIASNIFEIYLIKQRDHNKQHTNKTKQNKTSTYTLNSTTYIWYWLLAV